MKQQVKNIIIALLLIVTTASSLVFICTLTLMEKRRMGPIIAELHDLRSRVKNIDDLRVERIVNKDEQWSRLIEALIVVESSRNPNAIGDNGTAIGVLQIRPCVIEDVRRAGHCFALDDRYDIKKSIAIFNAYQNIYNPEGNIERAIHLHNPGAGVWYRDKVFVEMRGQR